MVRGALAPRISIVTPSFNQAAYLETTLRSVLDQGYPNLEYIVVDGGSTDGSVEILRRYQHRLSALVVEPDRGHAHALNKGFSRSTGEIMGWINSDDLLLPGSLSLVGELFRREAEMEWLTSAGSVLDPDGRIVAPLEPAQWCRATFLQTDERFIQQESTFWRRSLWKRSGGALSEDLLACDYELWARFFRHARIFRTRGLLGAFRYLPGQRSVVHRDRYLTEVYSVLIREIGSPELRTLPDSQANLDSEIRFDEKSMDFVRGDSRVAGAENAQDFRDLFVIAPELRDGLATIGLSSPPWRIERTDWIEGLFPDHSRVGEKGVEFSWMGSGEAEGFAWSLVSSETRRVRLRLKVAPGPSRPGGPTTLILRQHAGVECQLLARESFRAPTSFEHELVLARGKTRFSLSIPEAEMVSDLGPGDQRRLLAAISDASFSTS